MRHDSVIIKTNAYGLTLILNPDIPFEQLLDDTGKKFAEAARFFRNAQMALTFRGRPLTEEEEIALIDEITANAKINIVCLVDENKESSEKSREAIDEALEKSKYGTAQIYKGTIKNGMRLETEKNVIILGDVNPGAVVISTGNVIILGCCMGTVSAGAGGDESCFIAAMTLLAREIKIASYINRSAITKRIDRGDYPVDPKIAYLRHGHIFYEPLRSTAFEHMDALSAGRGTEETQERNNT